MADPTISLNRKITDPSMSDLLNMFKKEIMLSLNCHAIATVQSFDSSNQTVSATVNYKKSYYKLSTDGTYKMQLVDYPVLLDVPVLILGGGLAQITFPIQKGDECLILFNDRDLDNWFQSGQVAGVASGRLHSFSDGIAFVGLNSMPNVITDYDMTRAKFSYGSTMVAVGESLVKIANQTTTLKTVINGLIDVIEGLTTVPTVPGNPAALGPTSIAQLETYKTTVGGLLE
jgi:hypothetical protein